jgi:hypothetical protein
MVAIEKILQKQRAWQVILPADGTNVRAHATEALSICAEAVDVLSENLRKIGYTWITVERIPMDGIEQNVRRIETQISSTIPQVLVEFWKVVGGISFVDLENYAHVDFWKNHQIGPRDGFADGLHVDACTSEWASSICNDYLDWKNFNADDGEFLLSLAPDGYHKDNISGGAPYGVYLGSSWKPTWQNFAWSGWVNPTTALTNPPDFLSYLRTTILECAGFPALLGAPAFELLRHDLLKGVPLF